VGEDRYLGFVDRFSFLRERMPQALIVLGFILALAGIGSIAAGAPSWILGLGLGTALIQSGAVGLVGGFLLVGIGFVLRALRELSDRIDMLAVSGEAVAEAAPQPARTAPAPAPAAAPPVSRNSSPTARREAAPPPPSSSRREPPPLGRELSGRDEKKEPAPLERAGQEAFEVEPRRPRARFGETEAPRSEARVPPRPATPAERARERLRSTVERQPAYEDDYADTPPPPPPPARGNNSSAGQSSTVVRSGIIGGMAYTLYTDGSIEAELPIGTVRFASIEELQEHVNQTADDADVDFGAPRPSR
jgi:hypothetical protein